MENVSFKRFYEYYKLTSHLAVVETVQDLFGDSKSLFGDFVISISSGLAYAIWSYYQYDMEIDWFGVFVSVLVGFLVWGFILFLINLLGKVPVALYNHEKTSAISFSWEDIEIKPYYFKRGTGVGVGIEFVSDKNERDMVVVGRESARITSVTGNFNRTYYPNEEHKRPLMLRMLGGDGEIFQYRGDIRHRHKKDNFSVSVLPVANWDENEAWIVGVRGDGIGKSDVLLERGLRYSVTIRVQGQINSLTPMANCQIVCNLLYAVDEKDGHLKVKLDITHKNPKESRSLAFIYEQPESCR